MSPTFEYDPNFGSEDCQFNGEWRQMAKELVNDEPLKHAELIAALRDALEKNEIDLRPGDDRQLLGMLRAANMEVKAALKVVKHFLEYQKSAISAGQTDFMRRYFEANKHRQMILTHRDKCGRRVFVTTMWDPELFDYKDSMIAFGYPMMMLAREPKTQASGVTVVGDFSEFSRRHMPSSWEDVQTWVNLMKGGAPLHFHSIHVINAPWLLDLTLSIARPFLSEEMRKHFKIYKTEDDMKEFYENFGKDILPDCLGGEAGPIDDTKALNAMVKLENYFADVQKSSMN